MECKSNKPITLQFALWLEYDVAAIEPLSKTHMITILLESKKKLLGIKKFEKVIPKYQKQNKKSSRNFEQDGQEKYKSQ